jgi:hypothetical protein
MKSAAMAAADNGNNGPRARCARIFGPVASTGRLFGKVLETISAHWPMVTRDIHHFLPCAV